MRLLLPLALSVALPSVASAAPPAPVAPAPAAIAVHVGELVRDASGSRVGAISEVYGDGSVQVIYNSQLVSIPASTLSATDGKLSTSLTRKQLAQR